MSQPDTKDKILDAAELLFSREGFYGTSLRAITTTAGVNLAAVNYHFGSKEALLEAVLDRRLTPLNQRREQQLKAALESAAIHGRSATCREILRALVEPTLDLRRPESGAEAFVTLVGRLMADPGGIGQQLFFNRMQAQIQRFFEALCLVLPGLSKEIVYCRLHFAIGSLSHLMRCHDRAPVQGVTSAEFPVERLVELLLDYTEAGMEVPG